jgi:hypothetical protein
MEAFALPAIETEADETLWMTARMAGRLKREAGNVKRNRSVLGMR